MVDVDEMSPEFTKFWIIGPPQNQLSVVVVLLSVNGLGLGRLPLGL